MTKKLKIKKTPIYFTKGWWASKNLHRKFACFVADLVIWAKNCPFLGCWLCAVQSGNAWYKRKLLPTFFKKRLDSPQNFLFHRKGYQIFYACFLKMDVPMLYRILGVTLKAVRCLFNFLVLEVAFSILLVYSNNILSFFVLWWKLKTW